MRISFLQILVLLVLLCGFRTMDSQVEYGYEYITSENGLSRNQVKSVYKDHVGYLWIGNGDGVHRYDGTNMIHFKLNQDDSGIRGKRICFIVEDSIRNLWVGTDKGLFRFDRQTNCFSNIKIEGFQEGVYSYCEVAGAIVFGNCHYLAYYDYKTEDFEVRNLRGITWSDWFFDMATFSDGAMALCSKSGIYLLQEKGSCLKKIADVEIVGNVSLLVDQNDVLWVINMNNGVGLFDKEGRSISNVHIENEKRLSDIGLFDIEERGDCIWISTDGAGIFIFNTATERIQQLIHEQGNERSLPANSITDLYVDEFGNMCAGSIRAGLIVIRENFIHTYSEVASGSVFGVSNSALLGLHEDEGGNIWIGTDGGGLNCYNPSTDRFKHIPEFNDGKVLSICSYDSKRLLVSFYNGPIRLFNIDKQVFESTEDYPFVLELSDPWDLYPVILRKDSKGNIWKFGTWLKVLKTDNSIEVINKDNGWKGVSAFKEARFSCIDEINEDEIIAWGFNGSCTFNFRTKECKPLLSINDSLKLSRHFKYIYSTAKVDDHIWFVSSFGFYRYHIHTGDLYEIETKLFDQAYSVMANDDGSLWIGAANGLYRYFPENKDFKVYGRAEGARIKEYTPRSVIKSENGTIYFGGVDGLIKIRPGFNQDITKEEIKVTFVNIYLDGVTASESLLVKDEKAFIELPWDNHSFRVDLIVNENNFIRKRIFKYKLEGLSDMVYQTVNTSILFSHFPPGKYTLKVWCDNNVGGWVEESTDLIVYVYRPFWNQWWFILIIIVFVLLIILLIKANFKRQSKLVIDLQLERSMRGQLKEFNDSKLRFFTNVSHELRTPLTLIYGPLKKLVDERSGEKDTVSRQLNLMYRHAVKMKKLIDQVLEIRKLEAGKEAISLSEISLGKWLNEFLEQFKLEFDSKKINVTITGLHDQLLVCDADKLDRVLSNIVMNASKYSPIGGKIVVEIRRFNNYVIFSVSDEGPGVNIEELELIFEPFYQAKNHLNGTGVGLAYAKSLVELQGGEIQVENRPEGGSIFMFRLPILPNLNKLSEAVEMAPRLDEMEIKCNLDVLKSKKVLVVEDDLDLNKFISKNLSEYCEVLSAYNGEQGWQLIKDNSPDIVISDVMMPKLSGFELCMKLKSDKSLNHIPILLLTAQSDGQSRIHGYKVGADAYLNKPFDIDILCVRLVNILNNRAAQVELYQSGLGNDVQSMHHTNQDEVFLRKVTTIITKHMESSEFGVDDLVKEVAMSRSGFYAKIKAISGLGVHEYIKLVRINEAARLLKNETVTIGEIAHRVGFSNQQHFSKVFKEIKKCSPSNYRRFK